MQQYISGMSSRESRVHLQHSIRASCCNLLDGFPFLFSKQFWTESFLPGRHSFKIFAIPIEIISSKSEKKTYMIAVAVSHLPWGQKQSSNLQAGTVPTCLPVHDRPGCVVGWDQSLVNVNRIEPLRKPCWSIGTEGLSIQSIGNYCKPSCCCPKIFAGLDIYLPICILMEFKLFELKHHFNFHGN